MDQSMLQEESDDTWMFSGSSNEDEDGLSGMSQLFLSFLKGLRHAILDNFITEQISHRIN